MVTNDTKAIRPGALIIVKRDKFDLQQTTYSPKDELWFIVGVKREKHTGIHVMAYSEGIMCRWWEPIEHYQSIATFEIINLP